MVNVPDPDASRLAATLTFQGGRIRLSQAEDLQLDFSNLAGATIARYGRRFQAGEHAVTPAGLPPGSYLLRITGRRAVINGNLRTLP